MPKLNSLKLKEHAKLGLVIHAFFYVGVNAILISLNIMTNAHEFWAKWVVLGWGIGLAMHAIGVYISKAVQR